MRPFPRPLIGVARARHGLLTAAELSRERYVGRTRSTAIAAGMLVPVHRGIYRISTHEVTYLQRCAAALLAAPDAVLSGPTAAQLWNLRRTTTDDVHVIAHRSITLAGVHTHRTDFLRPADVTQRSGLAVLRPARLLCDLAWHLDDRALESVFEQMLERRIVTVPLVREIARHFAGRGRPGTRRLTTVLEARSDWLRPVDSDLELRLWRALVDRGVELERQHPVELDSGRWIRFDLADVAARIGIEVDHVTWHGGRLDVQADKRRDRETARIGWSVSRVTDDDINARLEATCDELLAILVRRRLDLGGR